MIREVIDLEIGDWLVIDNDTARRITEVEVHTCRGDGLHDGQVRVRMGEYVKVMRHTRKVRVLIGGAK